MTPQNSHLTITLDNEIHHVEFLDHNILEEAMISEIGADIGKIIEESSNPKILLCFKNVEHLSSAALGALITLNNKIKLKGGQLRLSDINERVYEIFQITKLNTLFVIHDNTEQAVASFA